ncbi:MAG: hypothetical protein AAFQ07_02930 [Chloroflexota bacterium]
MHIHEIVHKDILIPISRQFPTIKEMMVVSVAGYSVAGWDTEGRGPTIDYNPLEIMATVNRSILERIMEIIDGGIPRYSIFAGQDATHLVYRIGHENEFLLSVYIAGNPPFDPIINYIADRDHLSKIERFFDS